MIIFRYLAREVLLSMTAVTGVLLLIIMSGRFIKYLANAAAGKYSVEVVFLFMLYRLPGFLELILPLGLFLGVLLAYGRFYLESEMVVLKATGMSQRRLTMYTLGPALLVALMVSGISLVLSPAGAAKADLLLQNQSAIGEFDGLVAGRFQSTPKGERVSYTETLGEKGGDMTGVFISERDAKAKEPRLVVVQAEKGRQFTSSETGASYLVLENGYRYEGNPGEADYRQIKFKEYGIRLPEKEEISSAEGLETRTSSSLIGGNAAEQAQLHWRFSLPVLTLIVALMAVPLSKTNPRQGRFAKLIPSILLYLVYLLLLTNTRSYLEDGGGHVGLLWLIHLLFFALAMSLLFMQRFWRRKIRAIKRMLSREPADA